MCPQPFVVQPAGRCLAIDVIGVQISVLVSDADSETQQITLQTGNEGVGPPPHSHGWDESFFVISGEVHFVCDGQRTTCKAGTLVHVPAGTVHAFSFGPGGGEMLEITGAGSKAVPMFCALAAQIPPGPPDVSRVAQVAGEYGLALHLSSLPANA